METHFTFFRLWNRKWKWHYTAMAHLGKGEVEGEGVLQAVPYWGLGLKENEIMVGTMFSIKWRKSNFVWGKTPKIMKRISRHSAPPTFVQIYLLHEYTDTTDMLLMYTNRTYQWEAAIGTLKQTTWLHTCLFYTWEYRTHQLSLFTQRLHVQYQLQAGTVYDSEWRKMDTGNFQNSLCNMHTAVQ